MMIRKLNFRSIILVLAVFFTVTATVSIKPIVAEPPDETTTEEVNEGRETESDDVKLNTSNFYSSAIMSIDTTTREKEAGMDYVKNFSNSMITALSYDLSLVDPDTILMHALGIVINIIESIGGLMSLMVLIAYNLASSSFWKTTVATIFNTFDKAIFDWSDTSSWFYKIIVLFGLVAVIKKLLGSMKRVLTYKTIISTVIQVVVSCIVIITIAQSGRNVVSYVDTLVNQSISTSFNLVDDQYENSDLPVEINVKSMIFDILQKQGFTLRHFGVTSADQIPKEYKGTYKGKDWTAKGTGEKRLQTLLDNPSTENARIERQKNGNDQIGYSGAQCLIILGESFIFLVHRLLTALVIGGACVLLFGFSLVKEVSLNASVYGLVFMLFKNEMRVASSWFMARMKWTIMFIFVTLAFNMFLSFMIIFINAVAAKSLLFLLIFDIVAVFLMWYVVTHWQEIWEKITADLGISSDSTIIDAGKAILNGDIAPGDVYSNHKERIAKEKAEREAASDSTDEDMDTYSEDSVSSVKENDELADKESSDDESDEGNEGSAEDEDTDVFDVDKEFDGIDAENEEDAPDSDESSPGNRNEQDELVEADNKGGLNHDSETEDDEKSSISSGDNSELNDSRDKEDEVLNGEIEGVSKNEEYRKLSEEDKVSNSTDASDEITEHDEKVTEEQKDEIDSFLNELIEEDDET